MSMTLAAVAAASVLAQTPRDTTPAVIRAGRLFDSEAGAFLSNREVLIQGGRVTAVAEKVDRPAGARIIDLS